MRRLLPLAALILFARAGSATVLVPAEFREIVAGSQIIAHGRVAEIRAEWTDDRRQIDTVVTLDVSTYLKGGPGEVVTFRVPGGQVGRYRNVVVGAPEFREGEEAVVFLRAEGPAVARVFGLNQGVFRVRADPRTGRRLVLPPVLMAAGVEAEPVRRGSATRTPLPLDSFATTVRAAMAQARGAR